MRYEYQFMAMGVLSHVLVAREVPVLRELPLPVQLLLAVLPTALLLAPSYLPERLSLRAVAGLSLATGGLYLGWSLLLPVATLLSGVWGAQPANHAVASMMRDVVFQLPALLVSVLALSSAAEGWRCSRPTPSP